MAETRKYFGTDGIRGEVGKPPITEEFFLKLGWAAGTVLAGGRRGKVVIGRDTRVSGRKFESALEAGLAAAGTDPVLSGTLPTPAVAYLTRILRAAGGIVVSASHNPHTDNGAKFFTRGGGKMSDQAEHAIEAALDSTMPAARGADIGRAVRIDDAARRYIEFCKSTVPPGLTLRGLRIVVDCAHGATCHIAPSVFSELGAEVVPIGCAPDGLNINDGFGPLAPGALRDTVLERRADLGIAFDGDGDRVAMVDSQGEVVDGDEILFIIAEDRHARGRLNGSVVGTVMTNRGLEMALRSRGIELHRAQVGDRHVLELMHEHGCVVGGESSGHVVCLDRTTTGDGIVSALQVLHALVRSGRTLCEARRGMSRYPQALRNVRLRNGVDLESDRSLRDAVAAAEAALGTDGRVLLRRSGTEPVVRIMVESSSRAEVEQIADRITETVSEAVSAAAAMGR